MTKDEVLKFALEALESGKNHGIAIDVLRRVLAEQPAQQQKPLAWMTITDCGDEDDIWYENPEGKLLEGWTHKPLYTTPQPHQWVGLTDEDVYPLANAHLRHQPESYEVSGIYGFASAIAAKLKEKNNG